MTRNVIGYLIGKTCKINVMVQDDKTRLWFGQHDASHPEMIILRSSSNHFLVLGGGGHWTRHTHSTYIHTMCVTFTYAICWTLPVKNEMAIMLQPAGSEQNITAAWHWASWVAAALRKLHSDFAFGQILLLLLVIPPSPPPVVACHWQCGFESPVKSKMNIAGIRHWWIWTF